MSQEMERELTEESSEPTFSVLWGVNGGTQKTNK